MSLIAKDSGGQEFAKLPEGNHVARCIRVVDLGTQSFEWNGQKHSAPKVQLAFEVPDERIEIDGRNMPMGISVEYTKSLHEKAKLRAVLESWRGRKFSDQELDGFDIKKLLGIPALITVMHSEGRNGKTYANIVGVATAKIGNKSMECPPAENPLIFYEIEDRQGGTFDQLPKWTQEKILKAAELSAPADEQEPTSDPMSSANDDLPF